MSMLLSTSTLFHGIFAKHSGDSVTCYHIWWTWLQKSWKHKLHNHQRERVLHPKRTCWLAPLPEAWGDFQTRWNQLKSEGCLNMYYWRCEGGGRMFYCYKRIRSSCSVVQMANSYRSSLLIQRNSRFFFSCKYTGHSWSEIRGFKAKERIPSERGCMIFEFFINITRRIIKIETQFFFLVNSKYFSYRFRCITKIYRWNMIFEKFSKRAELDQLFWGANVHP